jgi:hypothetical protein
MQSGFELNLCQRCSILAFLNQFYRATRTCIGIAAALFVVAVPAQSATVQFFSGSLRTDATVTDCGSNCTLGALNTDSDYAQWAAVVDTFQVVTSTSIEVITYSYGGGTSLTGASVSAGGLEPYLSLFGPDGSFLASTFFGTTCPTGANSFAGNCFDVQLDGGTLTPGTYEIALTAFENMSSAENGSGTTLSDGFTGLGNLAPGENLNYAFDVILPQNVPEPVPEPDSAVMLTTGGTLLALLKRKWAPAR